MTVNGKKYYDDIEHLNGLRFQAVLELEYLRDVLTEITISGNKSSRRLAKRALKNVRSRPAGVEVEVDQSA